MVTIYINRGCFEVMRSPIISYLKTVQLNVWNYDISNHIHETVQRANKLNPHSFIINQIIKLQA